MNTIDLGSVLTNSNIGKMHSFLESFEQTLDHLLHKLKSAISDKNVYSVKRTLQELSEHAMVVSAQKLNQACLIMSASPGLDKDAIVAINVEAQRLKNEIKNRREFMSVNNEVNVVSMKMLNSSVLPSISGAQFESQYPKEIILNRKEKESLEFSLNPIQIFQSLQFQRMPSDTQVVVKKKKPCRCNII